MFRQCRGNKFPRTLQILFAVLGKESREARFVREGARGIVLWLEGFNLRFALLLVRLACAQKAQAHLPLVDVICVPWLLFLVRRRHDWRSGRPAALTR